MPNSYGHYGILPAKFPFKDFSLDLAQQEGSRDFRIQKRGRRLYRLAGACELSHLPMRFLALFPNGIERQIWRQSLWVQCRIAGLPGLSAQMARSFGAHRAFPRTLRISMTRATF